MPYLIVYFNQVAPILIDDPDPNMLVSYLERMNCAEVQALGIRTEQGCMMVAPHGSKRIIHFEDHDCVIIRPREIVSQQVGAEIALFFLENAGVPAGRSPIAPSNTLPQGCSASVG